jgi:Fic family protein
MLREIALTDDARVRTLVGHLPRSLESLEFDGLELKGTLDVSPWMEWFLGCLGRAFDGTEVTLAAVLRKARFWERHAGMAMNDRQRNILNRLLDGFTGKLTTTKWAMLAKTSHDTALRDIQALIDLGILRKDARGGRSTSYSLKEN